MKARYTKLILPLGLMIGIYAVCAAAFGAMTFAFTGTHQNRLVYLVWYITMFVEAVGVIVISCIWRMLSFKKTHLMERMSLLTIIVIGEGAIGVTKTVGRLMGKHGLDVEGSFLIMCIVVVLVSSSFHFTIRPVWYADMVCRCLPTRFISTTSLTATTEPSVNKYGRASTSHFTLPLLVSSKDRNRLLWPAMSARTT